MAVTARVIAALRPHAGGEVSRPAWRTARQIRLKGQGQPFAGTGRGLPGDALITVRIEPSTKFFDAGWAATCKLDLPITLVRGGAGRHVERCRRWIAAVAMTLPPGGNARASTLAPAWERPSRRPGAPAGPWAICSSHAADHVLPDTIDAKLEALMRQGDAGRARRTIPAPGWSDCRQDVTGCRVRFDARRSGQSAAALSPCLHPETAEQRRTLVDGPAQ